MRSSSVCLTEPPPPALKRNEDSPNGFKQIVPYKFKPSTSSPGLREPFRAHFPGVEVEYFGVEKNNLILFKYQTHFSCNFWVSRTPRDRAGAGMRLWPGLPASSDPRMALTSYFQPNIFRCPRPSSDLYDPPQHITALSLLPVCYCLWNYSRTTACFPGNSLDDMLSAQLVPCEGVEAGAHHSNSITSAQQPKPTCSFSLCGRKHWNPLL